MVARPAVLTGWLAVAAACTVTAAVQVKCLHVNYAHFLATGCNQVGEWVHAELLAGTDRTAGATERRASQPARQAARGD